MLVKSPLNYTGGKFRLLPQLLPLFPPEDEVPTFVDLFTGGANVAANYRANKVIAIDKQECAISLFDYLHRRRPEGVLRDLKRAIAHYHLSEVAKHGYAHYGCDSSKGVGAHNRPGYARLKEDYNSGEHPFPRDILFFLLIIFGFNNQIRFNKKGEFNIPVGKRDLNERVESNLRGFMASIHDLDVSFVYDDFRNLWSHYAPQKGDFVYADPPYLISVATYNEQGGWTEEDEGDLLALLDDLDSRGVRFALSNLLQQGEKKNSLLEAWMRKYVVHDIKMHYRNSSYQKNRQGSPPAHEVLEREILVTNYHPATS